MISQNLGLHPSMHKTIGDYKIDNCRRPYLLDDYKSMRTIEVALMLIFFGGNANSDHTNTNWIPVPATATMTY